MEPFLMFGLIIAYIWKIRAIYPNFWIVIPALMFLSHILHRETPRALGFELRGLANDLRRLAPLVALIAVAMLSAGALFHTFRPIGFGGILLALLPYLPWGLAQQYVLNGYFLNRLDALLAPSAAGVVAALLFSAAHAPNPFLMAVTLPLGWCATLLYRRTRNLYLLGIAHAVIGLLLFLVVPDSVSHHMRVGPSWFRPY
jgi:membrane protease YdiL (CAAX protease family)